MRNILFIPIVLLVCLNTFGIVNYDAVITAFNKFSYDEYIDSVLCRINKLDYLEQHRDEILYPGPETTVTKVLHVRIDKNAFKATGDIVISPDTDGIDTFELVFSNKEKVYLVVEPCSSDPQQIYIWQGLGTSRIYSEEMLNAVFKQILSVEPDYILFGTGFNAFQYWYIKNGDAYAFKINFETKTIQVRPLKDHLTELME